MDCPKCKRGKVAVACPSDDALVEIFSRLPAKPLFRFKCVSKDWCGLIADRLRCRKFPQTLEGFIAREGHHNDDENEGYDAFILSGRPVPLVDPGFSFLSKLPESERIMFLDSCNGLVLFEHGRLVSYSDSDDEDIYNDDEGSKHFDSLGYIVCNPATEEWVSMPRPSYIDSDDEDSDSDDEAYLSDEDRTYLIFDPAISPHFQLIHLRIEYIDEVLKEVHTFSSVTGSWSQEVEGAPSNTVVSKGVCCFDGMLHVGVRQTHLPSEHKHMILAVGGEGKPFRTLQWPKKDRGSLVFIGHSQGHLLCLSGCKTEHSEMTELSIWVLEDYNAEKWVLRDNASFSQLFGRMSGRCHVDWNVVGIHPDRNLVFFAEYWYMNHRLISYDMDKKEVCDICDLRGYRRPIIPYVPYFAQSAVLANKN